MGKKVEFMFGAGSVWTLTRQNHQSTNSIGGEVALDFMSWPAASRKLGWYLEPAYQYDFGGHDTSVGITIGLLIPVRR